MPPFAIYLLGALLVPFLKGRTRQAVALLIPAAALANFFLVPHGIHSTISFLDFELVLVRADARSLLFLNIFTVASLVGILYIIRDNDPLDLAAGLLYSGCAVGAVMAGDLITLFVFWEMLSLGAILCILARRSASSGPAAYRYLLVHVIGGVILFAGLVIHLANGGSTAFDSISLGGPGSLLIFLGFGVNCAWPLVGAWLTDTYPEASVGGIVFMAAFTTKTAVYVLSRTFPGEPSLIWIGLAMATVPLFYAAIENDLRRLLAYALINQVGFMVIGIGIGSDLSINGTYAHAYCHILYKSLLFMAVGSVIYRTGKSKATDLGGLCKSMPWTCAFCCIGAASISAPFFSGFVSKSIILSSAASAGLPAVWLILLFASAGAFLLAGIKVPFSAFFSRDSGLRPKDAPLNQLLAMGIVAALCIFVGSFPNAFLYPMLPHQEASYNPYTLAHVADQLALLLFCGLAFALLVRSGLYPADIRSTNLDADLLYRRSGQIFYRTFDKSLNSINSLAHITIADRLVGKISRLSHAAPARALAALASVYYYAKGLRGEPLAKKRQDVYNQTRLFSFPIGITASLAVLFLALLFFF